MSNRVHYSLFHLFVIVSFLPFICSTELSAADTGISGIQELYRLDRLPVLKKSIKVASISSYDRTGGSNDGFGRQYSYVRKENDGLVLADFDLTNIIFERVD